MSARLKFTTFHSACAVRYILSHVVGQSALHIVSESRRTRGAQQVIMMLLACDAPDAPMAVDRARQIRRALLKLTYAYHHHQHQHTTHRTHTPRPHTPNERNFPVLCGKIIASMLSIQRAGLACTNKTERTWRSLAHDTQARYVHVLYNCVQLCPMRTVRSGSTCPDRWSATWQRRRRRQQVMRININKAL